MKVLEDLRMSVRWLVLGMVCCLAVTLHAGTVLRPNIETGAPVEMEMDSWLERCPMSGMVAIRWRVANHSNEERTWRVDFSSGTRYNAASGTASNYAITVPAGQVSEMMLHVPLGNSQRDYYGGVPDLNWNITGPWVQGGGTLDSVGYSSTRTEYIALSEGSVGTAGWNELKKLLNSDSKSIDLAGSEVDMRKAPEDWRAYTGVGQLWMTDKEWVAMAELQRLAVLDWMTFGGQVTVLTENTTLENVTTMKLPPGISGLHRHGAGALRLVPWNGKDFPAQEAKRLVMKDVPTLRKGLSEYGEGWKLLKTVGELAINTPLVFGFMVVFGLLVGPVNLFWFAGAQRRSRLFWTTPLLSITGSLLLMVLMVVQDGFGGKGSRTALVLLQPEQKRMAVMQEQVSKTGILTSRGFAKKEPMMLLPLRVEGTGRPVENHALYQDQMDQASGDWFSSRAIQGQWLQTVRPTRATVEFFPAKDGVGTGAPEVLSSVDVTLTNLFLIDDEGRMWTAESVGTGERKKLEETKGGHVMWKFLEDATQGQMGPLMDTTLEEIKGRRGYFFAVADQPGGMMVETLSAIRWDQNLVVLAGPYVKQP